MQHTKNLSPAPCSWEEFAPRKETAPTPDQENSPTIPCWGVCAESEVPRYQLNVERMLSENLDKDKPRLMSPGSTHSLNLDLTPAQDALQKLTLWRMGEMNYHWGFLGLWGGGSDTLYPSITTFYKCYSIMKDFRDYVNQDKSTDDTSLNRMRLSRFFFFFSLPLQRRGK